MKPTDNACYQCRKRHLGCHSTCKDDDPYKKEQQKLKNAKKEESDYYAYLHSQRRSE